MLISARLQRAVQLSEWRPELSQLSPGRDDRRLVAWEAGRCQYSTELIAFRSLVALEVHGRDLAVCRSARSARSLARTVGYLALLLCADLVRGKRLVLPGENPRGIELLAACDGEVDLRLDQSEHAGGWADDS